MSLSVENFGRNVRFAPARLLLPRDDNAVLAILEQHRTGKIRAAGMRHSWSPLIETSDVVVDLRHLDAISVEPLDDGTAWATIGAGCTIDRVLDYLSAHGGYTLPAYGMNGRQTIAGAIATGTHGSGLASLSHFVSGVRVAAYDAESGQPRMYEWHDGDELRAVRCGLGCLGILLSIRIRVEPDYQIEEMTQWFDRLEPLLALESQYPRQQCYLVPWSWKWYAQLRRPVAATRAPSVAARGLRAMRYGGVDLTMNGLVRWVSGSAGWWTGLRWFYQRLFPLLARPDMLVVDEARELLMMRHDLYTHVEMELLVPEHHIVHAAAFAEWVLRWCSGETPEMPDVLRADRFGTDVTAAVRDLRGSYNHDHLITVRKVLHDDTLISMTSGDDASAWYALSFITYQRDLAPFLRVAKFVASAMAPAFGARPHWGKIFPLDAEAVKKLYSALPQFRDLCARVDPDQVFVNDFVRDRLGFEVTGASSRGHTMLE